MESGTASQCTDYKTVTVLSTGTEFHVLEYCSAWPATSPSFVNIMNIAHAILVLRAPCMRYRVCVLLVLSYRIQNATTVKY